MFNQKLLKPLLLIVTSLTTVMLLAISSYAYNKGQTPLTPNAQPPVAAQPTPNITDKDMSDLRGLMDEVKKLKDEVEDKVQAASGSEGRISEGSDDEKDASEQISPATIGDSATEKDETETDGTTEDALGLKFPDNLTINLSDDTGKKVKITTKTAGAANSNTNTNVNNNDNDNTTDNDTDTTTDTTDTDTSTADYKKGYETGLKVKKDVKEILESSLKALNMDMPSAPNTVGTANNNLNANNNVNVNADNESVSTSSSITMNDLEAGTASTDNSDSALSSSLTKVESAVSSIISSLDKLIAGFKK